MKKLLREFADVVSFVFKKKKNLVFIGNFSCVTKKTLISEAKRKTFFSLLLLLRKIIYCALSNRKSKQIDE